MYTYRDFSGPLFFELNLFKGIIGWKGNPVVGRKQHLTYQQHLKIYSIFHNWKSWSWVRGSCILWNLFRALVPQLYRCRHSDSEFRSTSSLITARRFLGETTGCPRWCFSIFLSFVFSCLSSCCATSEFSGENNLSRQLSFFFNLCNYLSRNRYFIIGF